MIIDICMILYALRPDRYCIYECLTRDIQNVFKISYNGYNNSIHEAIFRIGGFSIMTLAPKKLFHTCLMVFFAALFLTILAVNPVYAEKPYKTCEPEEVHSIWYKGKIRYNLTATCIETKKKVKISKGTKVIVKNYSQHRKQKKVLVMLKNKKHFYVKRNAFYLYGYACTPGDYSDETKEAFVNWKGVGSQTKYMIWVSTDMQSLNVFKGSRHNWELVKSFKCSTGMYDWQTPLGYKKIVAKVFSYHSEQWGSNLLYFLSFGGSGIHKWPGSGGKKYLGKQPCSHACVRLTRTASRWMYKHIPKNTRLYIF